jgi:predicted enzyme related to lactoylglutathione lyase
VDQTVSRSPQSYLHGHLVLVIDCGDLDRAARFWTSVLGYVGDRPARGPYQSLVPADGQGVEILLQRVPEAKSIKNRLHLDLRTTDLDAEVERVVALGARRLTGEPVTEDGMRWHILADPDGNEFCVLQPPPAYWQRLPPTP